MVGAYLRTVGKALLCAALLAACNLPEPTRTAAPTAGILRGTVRHDLCSPSGGLGGSPPAPSPGGFQREDSSYRGNGVHESGEPGLVGVLVSWGRASAHHAAWLLPSPLGRRLRVHQPECRDLLCQRGSPQRDRQQHPGAGRVDPAPNIGEITFVLGAGDELVEVNLGWDHQFLPWDTEISSDLTSSR